GPDGKRRHLQHRDAVHRPQRRPRDPTPDHGGQRRDEQPLAAGRRPHGSLRGDELWAIRFDAGQASYTPVRAAPILQSFAPAASFDTPGHAFLVVHPLPDAGRAVVGRTLVHDPAALYSGYGTACGGGIWGTT